jgi:hypothetical protein
MPFVLRKISRAKWREAQTHPPGGQPVSIERVMQADVFSDLKTDTNLLSVWHIEDSLANLENVLTALAANCERFTNVDYVLLDGDVLEALSIDMKQTEGASVDQNVNQWHRDLHIGTAGKLMELAREIYSRPDTRQRMPEKKLKSLLVGAVSTGRIEKSKLKDPLRVEVEKLISSSRPSPSK